MGAREGRAADRVGIFISFFFFAFWHAWKSKTVFFLIRERVQSTMRRITTPKRGQKEVIQAQSIFQKGGARRLISLFFFSSE